jgi:hypothetical protein
MRKKPLTNASGHQDSDVMLHFGGSQGKTTRVATFRKRNLPGLGQALFERIAESLVLASRLTVSQLFLLNNWEAHNEGFSSFSLVCSAASRSQALECVRLISRSFE